MTCSKFEIASFLRPILAEAMPRKKYCVSHSGVFPICDLHKEASSGYFFSFSSFTISWKMPISSPTIAMERPGAICLFTPLKSYVFMKPFAPRLTSGGASLILRVCVRLPVFVPLNTLLLVAFIMGWGSGFLALRDVCGAKAFSEAIFGGILRGGVC